MLPTVHFNDQSLGKTNEINDEKVQRLLSSKLESFKSMTSEQLPQTMFGFRWFGAHGLGSVA